MKAWLAGCRRGVRWVMVMGAGATAAVWAQSGPPTCAAEVCAVAAPASSAAPAQVGEPVVPAAPRTPGLPDKPLWELGLATLALHTPDYPGAGSHHWRGAMAPIAIYRGKRLRFDDEGVRGRLVNTGRVELDISGAASFNARQSEARRGMPPLDYTFEIGPQVLYRFAEVGGHQFSAHLKARAVMSSNWRQVHGRGAVFEPELRWQRQGWPDAASSWVLVGQGMWASEALHDYFYEVAPAYATATRPAYEAHGGYFGSQLRGSYTRRLNGSTVLSLGATAVSYRGAANAASPLLQRRETLGVFAAVIWTPLRSAELARP